jgi:site-specific recombinase XerD
LHPKWNGTVTVELAAGLPAAVRPGRADGGEERTTYELRHPFVSLVADQLDDLVKVADLVGHADTRTTQGYRHAVRPSLPHAIEA